MQIQQQTYYYARAFAAQGLPKELQDTKGYEATAGKYYDQLLAIIKSPEANQGSDGSTWMQDMAEFRRKLKAL